MDTLTSILDLSNKKVFYLFVVGKPTCFSGLDERRQYNKLVLDIFCII